MALTLDQKREALAYALEDDWRGDAWGTAMSHLFAIADVLSHTDGAEIPTEWGFQHGLGCDTDMPYRAEYLEMLTCERGLEMVTYAGKILNMKCDQLDRMGKSY